MENVFLIVGLLSALYYMICVSYAGLELANSYEIIKDSKAKVLIVSTNFHIFRACLIAKKTGFENVYSYPAKSDMIILPNFMLREAIGITKDFILGNL